VAPESKGISAFFLAYNDGSADHTPQILDELARRYDKIHVIHHPRTETAAGRCADNLVASNR
jgi:hypothetical protein